MINKRIGIPLLYLLMRMAMKFNQLLKYLVQTMQLMQLIKKVHLSAGVKALLVIKESQEMLCLVALFTTQKIEYLQKFTLMAIQLYYLLQ